MGSIRHEALESLILQSAGLSAQTLWGLATIRAAKLRHLEVWTGEDQERGERLEAVCPLCWPWRASLPGLQTLGVRSCGWLDELMEALRRAPIRSPLPQRRALELSMGALTDRGLEALLSCPWLDQLSSVDLSGCFIEDRELMEPLRSRGVEVIAGQPRERQGPWDTVEIWE